MLAKAVLIRGKDHPFDLIDGTGAEAMVVDDDGGIRVTEGFRTYLGFGWLPESLELDS